jgi:hypothetical protein
LGNQNGRKDLPATDDVSPDEAHRQIESTVTELFESGRAAALNEAARLEDQRNQIDLKPVERIISTIQNNINMKIKRVMSEQKKTLLIHRREERAMLRDLKYFIESNQIHHEPRYPESNIFHISIILALVVMESLANSYFFSKGSDMGLLGGTLQAMLISIANVGLSVMVGIYVMRNLHHILIERKVTAALGVLGYLSIIFLFNLATAHYRAQLEINALLALNNTIPSLRKGLFWIDNFDAWVLFVIGLISSSVALADGYLADDRYPNFGNVHRRYRKALIAYEAAKQMLLDAINQAVDDGQAELNSRVDRAREDCNEFSRLLARSKSLQDGYQAFCNAIEECYRTLLSMYRTANRKVRSSVAPGYFEDFLQLCSHSPLPVGDLAAAERKVKELEDYLANIDHLAQTHHVEFRNINDRALKDAELFLKDVVEREADAATADEARIAGLTV